MKYGLPAAILACAFLVPVFGTATAQDDSTVRISFERESKRIDIVTGKTLPNYTKAQRSSLQFFNGRLDKPEKRVLVLFRRPQVPVGGPHVFHPKAEVHRHMDIAGSGRWGEADQTKSAIVPTAHPNTNCEIEHHAVSFIPLNPATGKADPRVYVLLEDLELIQWRPYNHWLVTMPQKELESLKGIVY